MIGCREFDGKCVENSILESDRVVYLFELDLIELVDEFYRKIEAFLVRLRLRIHGE